MSVAVTGRFTSEPTRLSFWSVQNVTTGLRSGEHERARASKTQAVKPMESAPISEAPEVADIDTDFYPECNGCNPDIYCCDFYCRALGWLH